MVTGQLQELQAKALPVISKQLSCSILSAVAFCSRSKTSIVISKDIRVTHCNLSLLDWYLSPSTSALTCCWMIWKRGQQGTEKVDLRETSLWVRRGDILLQRRPLSSGQTTSPLGQNALSVSGILFWWIQEGSPDRMIFWLSGLLWSHSETKHPASAALLLYYRMTIMLPLDAQGSFVLILFFLHQHNSGAVDCSN